MRHGQQALIVKEVDGTSVGMMVVYNLTIPYVLWYYCCDSSAKCCAKAACAVSLLTVTHTKCKREEMTITLIYVKQSPLPLPPSNGTEPQRSFAIIIIHPQYYYYYQ